MPFPQPVEHAATPGWAVAVRSNEYLHWPPVDGVAPHWYADVPLNVPLDAVTLTLALSVSA